MLVEKVSLMMTAFVCVQSAGAESEEAGAGAASAAREGDSDSSQRGSGH